MRNTITAVDRDRGPMAAGWLVSCLLHGGLAAASILFVQRLQLVPQAEPFRWDVAMVGSLSPTSQAPSSATANTPPPPMIQRSASPITDAHPSVKPVQPMTTAPVDSPLPTPASEFSSETQQKQSSISEPSLSGLTPSMADLPPPTASQQFSTPLTDPVTPVHNSSVDSAETQPPTDSLLDPSSSSMASAGPTTPLRSAKVDYGWLSEQMARWIEDLDKRYPAILRTEGVQGKVTLAAMLHEDGLLSDVRILKSSGNPALDQVALEDVKNGPPVELSRSLERSKMSVKFSIVYDLKTIR